MEGSEACFAERFSLGSDGNAAERGEGKNVCRAHREAQFKEEIEIQVPLVKGCTNRLLSSRLMCLQLFTGKC